MKTVAEINKELRAKIEEVPYEERHLIHIKPIGQSDVPAGAACTQCGNEVILFGKVIIRDPRNHDRPMGGDAVFDGAPKIAVRCPICRRRDYLCIDFKAYEPEDW